MPNYKSQGYNLSGGNLNTSNGAEQLNKKVTTESGTKYYIMNGRRLVTTMESSAATEASKVPNFDFYKTPEDRLEYSLFNGEYYCASDVKIYLGDIWIDDAISVEYAMNERVTPIFGYASHTYDDIARGQRLVSGGFSINFKSAGYMQNVLKYADAIMYSLKVGESKGSVQAIDYQNYKLNELLIRLGKRSFEEIAKEYEAALWGELNDENQMMLNHDLIPYFPDSNLGFDIRINYGAVEEIMKSQRYEYYADIYNFQEPAHTVEVINGVQLTGMTKGIATSQQATPITENYMFLARDLNGISKDRFIADLQFQNMEEEGTMFGNATAQDLDNAYQGVSGYVEQEFSADGVRIDPDPSAYVEVKYIKNYDGDTATFFVKEWQRNIDVRLTLVDSFEMDSKNTFEFTYAEKAREALTAILSKATTIKLEFESNSKEKVKDDYGRYTAYVHADGTIVNVELANKGLVKFGYTFYGNKRYKNEIQQAEEAARLRKVGLWSQLPHEPHFSLSDYELERFFTVKPEYSGFLTVEEWKNKNKGE